MNSKKSVDPFYSQFHAKGKQLLKEHVKQQNESLCSHQDQHESSQHFNEDTMTKCVAVPKIRVLDDEETKKVAWENKNSTQPLSNQRVHSNQSEYSQSASPSQNLQAPINSKVESILARKSLRERFGNLLLPNQQLPISFNHQQLLKRMELIDRTIDFLAHHRSMKLFFFETIKKNIYQTGNTVIEYRNLEQLTFLDENVYGIDWKFNEKLKRYDLNLVMPIFESMDARKGGIRDKIIQYLRSKEAEFLKQNKLEKQDESKWHPQFKYQQVEIACKNLPVHPNNESADLRTLSEQSLEKIRNPVLKMLLESKKKKMDVKSMSGASVADMIFSKMSAQDISTHISRSIREKEKQQLEQLKLAQVEDKVDLTTIAQVLQEILLIYMEKKVSNIFKMTVIELLQKRLKVKNEVIQDYLERIISEGKIISEGQNFLTEIESSQKVKVLRINRHKYDSIREFFLKKLKKQ